MVVAVSRHHHQTFFKTKSISWPITTIVISTHHLCRYDIWIRSFFYNWPHLAGDGSFRERKKFKEFCQFRLNLLIKISYIPDLKKKYPGVQKLWPKKDFFVHNSAILCFRELRKKLLAVPPKLAIWFNLSIFLVLTKTKLFKTLNLYRLLGAIAGNQWRRQTLFL